jgi:hypothetical protein
VVDADQTRVNLFDRLRLREADCFRTELHESCGRAESIEHGDLEIRPSKRHTATGFGRCKGWFTILRLYSPLESFFSKKRRPSEIEVVN